MQFVGCTYSPLKAIKDDLRFVLNLSKLQINKYDLFQALVPNKTKQKVAVHEF